MNKLYLPVVDEYLNCSLLHHSVIIYVYRRLYQVDSKWTKFVICMLMLSIFTSYFSCYYKEKSDCPPSSGYYDRVLGGGVISQALCTSLTSTVWLDMEPSGQSARWIFHGALLAPEPPPHPTHTHPLSTDFFLVFFFFILRLQIHLPPRQSTTTAIVPISSFVEEFSKCSRKWRLSRLYTRRRRLLMASLNIL